ncbi:unnamed protein product [Schistosoma rodhaini]|uniref:Uncharacterized protein n=1 Tax=Schistosoma rodhaini TaxID=6188 RepID=A0AA85FV97_9TREM|nr:unnamed protein product [Schistosoma rodhaini]
MYDHLVIDREIMICELFKAIKCSKIEMDLLNDAMVLLDDLKEASYNKIDHAHVFNVMFCFSALHLRHSSYKSCSTISKCRIVTRHELFQIKEFVSTLVKISYICDK